MSCVSFCPAVTDPVTQPCVSESSLPGVLQPCLGKAAGTRAVMASQHNVLHNSDWNDTGAAQVQLQTLWLFTPSMKEIVNAYLLEVEKQQIYTICIID